MNDRTEVTTAKVVDHRRGISAGTWMRIAADPNPAYAFREDYGRSWDPDAKPTKVIHAAGTVPARLPRKTRPTSAASTMEFDTPMTRTRKLTNALNRLANRLGGE